jgi:hypothetical protein
MAFQFRVSNIIWHLQIKSIKYKYFACGRMLTRFIWLRIGTDWAVVNTVMNVWVTQKVRNFLTT